MTEPEQQARREAEEKYPSAYSGSVMLSQRAIHRIEEFEERNDIRREAYAAALISERSKPSPTCEPICGDHGGINGCSCSNCSTPIGPPEFSRYCGNCGRKVIWPEGANYRQRRE